MRPFGNRDSVALTCLGVSSVLANLVVLAWFGIRHGGDTFKYLEGAADLLAGRPFPWMEGGGLFFGYVGLIALADAVGIGRAGIIGFQFGAAALATLALYDLGRQLSGRPAGVLAAAVFVVDVDIARWNVYLLTDSLYISLVVLATWLVHRAVGRGIRAYVAAACVGLFTALIRPNGWIFGPIALVYWTTRTELDTRLKYAVWACVVLMCAGSALGLATIVGGVATAPTDVPHAQTPIPGETAGMKWRRWSNRGLEAKPAAGRVLKELLHVRSYYSAAHNAVVLVVIAITYPLAVLGFVRRRDQPLTRLLAAVIAGHLLLVAVTFADWDGRYLLHIFSLIVVFAACGAIRLAAPRPGVVSA